MTTIGTFIYVFDCSNESYVTDSTSGVLKNLPFVTTDGCMVIDNSSCTLSNGTATVSVDYTFTDNGSTNDGLRFYSVYSYYNDSTISNLQITSFSNVPLSRNGYHFSNLIKLNSVSSTDTPTILSNTQLNFCFGSTEDSNYSNAITTINLSNWTNTSNITSASCMFHFSPLTAINMTGWNTSNIYNMQGMFAKTLHLTTINGISGWNVSNVIYLNQMFYGCSSIVTLDLSNWNVSKVENLREAFTQCDSLTTLGDLSNWNTSTFVDLFHFASQCPSLTSIGDLSQWDVSNVIVISYMFYNCSSLENIGNVYDNWVITSVTSHDAFSVNSRLYGRNIPNWDGIPYTIAILSAPTNLSSSNIGFTTATVSFTRPLGADSNTSYTIISSDSSISQTVNYPETTFSLTSLSTGTSYSFTITVTNSAGTSGASDPVSFTTSQIPSAHTFFYALTTETAATVSFTPPIGADNNTTYTINSSDNNNITQTISYPATSFLLTGLTLNNSYSFTIQTTNTDGTSSPITFTFTFIPTTYSWYSIDISYLTGGSAFFTGYFSVDNNTNVIRKFYNSTNTGTNIVAVTQNDYGASYIFVNNGFDYGGTTITSIPALDSQYNAIEWSLWAENNISYKSSQGNWIDLGNTSYIISFNFLSYSTSSSIIPSTSILGAPTNLSSRDITPTTATVSFTQPQDATSGTTYIAKSIGTIYGITSYPATSISLTGLSSGTSYSFTVTSINDSSTSSESSSTSFTTRASSVISNICFPAKTPIVTNQGIIDIDKLNPEIHTIRNKKISAITRTISNKKHILCIEMDAIGKNIPSKRTLVTAEHKIFYNGRMIEAKHLTKLDGIYTVKYTGEILYNVLMEEHEKMLVNNLIVETLDPENIVAEIYRNYKNPTSKDQENYMKIQENYLKNIVELKRKIQRK